MAIPIRTNVGQEKHWSPGELTGQLLDSLSRIRNDLHDVWAVWSDEKTVRLTSSIAIRESAQHQIEQQPNDTHLL